MVSLIYLVLELQDFRHLPYVGVYLKVEVYSPKAVSGFFPPPCLVMP
jgi:hypothetical protein